MVPYFLFVTLKKVVKEGVILVLGILWIMEQYSQYNIADGGMQKKCVQLVNFICERDLKYASKGFFCFLSRSNS